MKNPGRKMTLYGFLIHLLLGIALAFMPGCGTSPEGSQQKQPSATATPEGAQTPETAPQAVDPVAAARLERVRSGIEQGLDVNRVDAEGRTALMMAAFEGYSDIVGLLLEHGAEVDKSDSAGRTALMYAASGPFPQTVKLLIQSGADVNHADEVEHWTALMLAAAEGHKPVVELLLQHGAKIDTTDEDGDSAIDHARRRGQKTIVDLLNSRP